MMPILNIYTYKERLAIQLNQNLMQGSLKELKEYILSILGFSSQLYLYHQPLSTFSRLSFIHPSAIVKAVVEEFAQICFTFNNRQHIEEPDFLAPVPSSCNDLLIVAQTCQEAVFSFDRYKIDSKSRMSFLKSLTSRIGNNVFVSYYQLRIPIDQFGNEEYVSNTIAKLAYPNRTVVIISDEEVTDGLCKSIQNITLVDYEEYYLITIEGQDRSIVMSRQADWNVVLYCLSLIFKVKFVVKDPILQSQGHSLINKDTNKVTLIKKTTQSKLIPALNTSFFLGKTSSYLIFLEQSSILHVYSSVHPFQRINSTILCSQSCNYLEEEVPVLMGNQLIMYNITVTCIVLKYYTLPLGELKYVRHFKWQQEYRGVKVDTLDIISVYYKSNVIRVFYVYSPNHFIQLKSPDVDWMIFVSKHGYNSLSDGSGLLGLGGVASLTLHVYNLVKQQKIAEIALNNLLLNIQSVSFNNTEKTILINHQTFCQEYSYEGIVKLKYEKETNKIYCYGINGKIFQASPNTFQWLEQAEMRIKNGILLTGQIAMSFNSQLRAGSFSEIYQTIQKQ